MNASLVPCRLFKQYILLVLMNQMASALFKMMAALGRNMIVANTFGAFSMLVFFALGGVVLSKGIYMCSSCVYVYIKFLTYSISKAQHLFYYYQKQMISRSGGFGVTGSHRSCTDRTLSWPTSSSDTAGVK